MITIDYKNHKTEDKLVIEITVKEFSFTLAFSSEDMLDLDYCREKTRLAIPKKVHRKHSFKILNHVNASINDFNQRRKDETNKNLVEKNKI